MSESNYDHAMRPHFPPDPEESTQITVLDRIVRKAHLRTDAALVSDIVRIIREHATYRWRIGELQKILDDGKPDGDRWVVRMSKPVVHFLMTGQLPDGTSTTPGHDGRDSQRVVVRTASDGIDGDMASDAER